MIIVGGAFLIAITSAAVAVAASELARDGSPSLTGSNQVLSLDDAVDDGPVDNVILLVGDGMGDSEITSARNYEYGIEGRLPGIDALPLTGQFTTHSLTKNGGPDYVADSAATGTAWATGTKTFDGAIGVDVEGKPKSSLLELAKKKGLGTGNVSTAAIHDATPAVQVAHVPSRSCSDPDEVADNCPESALENGGPGSIAEQLLTTRPDVSLGGGEEAFEEKAEAGEYADLTLLDQAQRRGFQLVDDLDALEAVDRADQKSPLLGLFAAGHLPVPSTGPKATLDGAEEAAVPCEPNDSRSASAPTLAQMTDKAISLLDENDQDGFFLQVEGASIDKKGHGADACGQIGSVIEFDDAVQAALKFAEKDERTAVLVTADHAQTSQIVQAGKRTRGLTVNLLTEEGAPMTLSYATGLKGESQEHTGSQVTISGYGPQAANVMGLNEQTDLFDMISRALRLQNQD